MDGCSHDNAIWFSRAWHCSACQHTLPENAALDSRLIYEKVDAILHEMDDAGAISISNGTEGAILLAEIARECRRIGSYTEATITTIARGDVWAAEQAVQSEKQRVRNFWVGA